MIAKRGGGDHHKAKRVDVVDQHIGERIRVARINKGLSQTEVGNAVGVTFQQIQKYEKGVNRISGSRMQSLAKLLDVPLMFFYEGQPGGNGKKNLVEADPCHRLGQTRTGHRLAVAALAMSDGMRAAIMTLAEQLVAEGK